MSDNRKIINRGESIKPAARKSIHSHRNYCPFAIRETIMGGYGLPSSRSNATGSIQDLGRDEPDNVMSKPLRQSLSPKRLQVKRNSFNHENQDPLLLDESNCVLSQSLPATLPSHSYYSDDSDEDISAPSRSADSHYSSQSSDHERHHIRKRYRNTPNTNSSSIRSSPNIIGDGLNSNNAILEGAKSNNTEIRYGVLSIVSVIFAIFTIVWFAYTSRTDSKSDVNYEYKFYQDLNELWQRFDIVDDSLQKVHAGMATIYEKEIAGSFIFIYNSNNKNYSEDLFNDFMDKVARTSAKYLRNDYSTRVNHLVLEGDSLRTDDDLIRQYRDTVAARGVMLVKDMDHVPSSLAMAFHYYCDEYDPLIKKSAVFFTLDLNSCSSHRGQNIYALLEKCLAVKWEGLQEDNIGPLLTRVVSVVVDVTDAF